MFTRDRKKFESFIKKLGYNNIHKLETEIGKRIRFDKYFSHKDFDLALIINIYKTLKRKWTKLYYALEYEELKKFIRQTPNITIEKVMENLGYNLEV